MMTHKLFSLIIVVGETKVSAVDYFCFVSFIFFFFLSS